ncbi:MAG: hypothetical protein ACTSRN_07450 [Alphaproteobacteria bacterium]
MKYLLTIKRTGSFESKIAKDISTASDLEFFLLDNGAHQDFRKRFDLMPGKWQKDLMEVLEKYRSGLVDILT